MPQKLCKAELLENRLIIWDPKHGSEIYKLGFYGKPVGIPKPKTMEFNTPLTLDLIEGLYLLEKRKINVYEGPEKTKVSKKKLQAQAEKVHDDFSLKYLVYKDLRGHGYVVTPGIKFGCDFAVYEHGPGIDHAPFLIQVKPKEEEISATEIVRAGRLATTVKKRFIIAVPDSKIGKVQYLMFRWWRA